MHLSNCLLQLHAGPGPCTTDALNQLTGCVGHVLTSSELVLKDVLRQVGLRGGSVDGLLTASVGVILIAVCFIHRSPPRSSFFPFLLYCTFVFHVIYRA